jgi:hypothetical protein
MPFLPVAIFAHVHRAHSRENRMPDAVLRGSLWARFDRRPCFRDSLLHVSGILKIAANLVFDELFELSISPKLQ